MKNEPAVEENSFTFVTSRRRKNRTTAKKVSHRIHLDRENSAVDENLILK